MTRSMKGIRPPKHPFEYNGIEWPTMKIKGTWANFAISHFHQPRGSAQICAYLRLPL